MKWIKASELFPEDPNEKVFRRKQGAMYQYIQTEDFNDQYLEFNNEMIEYRFLEWLDESPTPSTVSDKEAELFELVDGAEAPKEPGIYYTNIGQIPFTIWGSWKNKGKGMLRKWLRPISHARGNEGVLVEALEKIKSFTTIAVRPATKRVHDLASEALATYKKGDGWISVEWVKVDGKNFPPKNDKYYYWLYSESIDNYEIGYYDFDHQCFYSNGGDELRYVSHWVLPQPPSNQ